jgi:hypothetical protein
VLKNAPPPPSKKSGVPKTKALCSSGKEMFSLKMSAI